MNWISSKSKILLMLAPAVILFTLFMAYPVAYSAAFSLTRFQGFGTPRWTGLGTTAS